MTLEQAIAARKVVDILHFTTNRGIVGTLASHTLLSRHRLPQEKYLEHVLHINAATRPEATAFFDKSQNWLDYVNLSISEINARYFAVSNRWHRESNVWWGILAFDSDIMTHEGVVFATTNNSYDCCVRQSGIRGFESLFAPQVLRKAGWTVSRKHREARLPTCEQAEVLYPAEVPTKFLRNIYVQEEEHHDQAQGWLWEFGLRDVEVLVSPKKFTGKPN
jgi:hypothetical protein